MKPMADRRLVLASGSPARMSLLRNAGMPISEAMAFGLSGALAFAYLPFLLLSGNVGLFIVSLARFRRTLGSMA